MGCKQGFSAVLPVIAPWFTGRRAGRDPGLRHLALCAFFSIGNLLVATHSARAVQVGDLLVADSQQANGHGIILDINPNTGA
jgi:hypothetical protein